MIRQNNNKMRIKETKQQVIDYQKISLSWIKNSSRNNLRAKMTNLRKNMSSIVKIKVNVRIMKVKNKNNDITQ